MSVLSKIKNWAKVANPHKGYLAGNYIACISSILITIVQAYPAANVITSLTNLDYNAAIFWLLIGLLCTLLFYISESLDYYFYYKQCNYIIVNLSDKLYKKIGLATEEGLSSNSIEKLMLVFTANLNTLQGFTDYICYQVAYLLRALITGAIVCFYNLYIGLIIFALIFLLYFWFKFLAKKDNQITTTLYGERDKMGEKITDLIQGRKFSEQLNVETQNKEEYLDQIKHVVKKYSKRGQYSVLRSNWTYAILYGIIIGLTIWLAFLTHAHTLTITMYLVIAPYLINVINYTREGYEILKELERADVCRLRIETVLNMPEQDMISYSNNTTDNLSGNLAFNNVSYKDTAVKPYNSGDLATVNFNLAPHSITVFKGVANCGKRSIFYLLRRTIKPTTGTITMDGINIYDFDKETYRHNFSYCTSKPYFYSESIIENLSYSNSSKKKIYSTCKSLGIHSLIVELPNGYETNLTKEVDNVSRYLLFMIGLARAVLSRAEWICIYEFPISLTKAEQDNIKKMLKYLRAKHSFIVFTASDTISDIADNSFVVSSGKVRTKEKETTSKGGTNE